MASKAKTGLTLGEQITSLEPGESLSQSKRLTTDDLEEGSIKEAVAGMRNVLNQTVSRLRKKGAGEYRVESVTAMTDDQMAIIATVCVTRLPGDAGDDDLGI